MHSRQNGGVQKRSRLDLEDDTRQFTYHEPWGNMAAATNRPSSFKMLNVEVALA